MHSSGGEITLNEAQLRAIGVTLTLVEQAVAHTERILDEPEAGITFRFGDTVAPEECQAIGAVCVRLRATVAEARACLGVEVADRSRRRELRGTLAVLWAMLEDTKSHALRGYGPLSPESGAVVDSLLGAIISGVKEILALVEPGIRREASALARSGVSTESRP